MDATSVQWAQICVSGVAILASGCIAVYVPHRARQLQRNKENRGRLNVTTTRSEPSSLRLDIAYQSEFAHDGIFARVTLNAPLGARMSVMSFTTGPAMVGNRHQRLNSGGGTTFGVAHVPLVRLDREGPFSGGMLVLPIDDLTVIYRAKLRFEILTQSEERLLRVDLSVSPTDEILRPDA